MAKIRAAKAALRQIEQAAQAKLASREQRVGRAKGKPATVPDPAHVQPAPKAQRNFTDPDSRIMKDGATNSFEQAYNAYAAVDGHAQVIVACRLTQVAADVQEFVPLLELVTAHTGMFPTVVTADAGYFSEANLRTAAAVGIDAYVPPDRHGHGQVSAPNPSRLEREKLRTPAGAAIYRRRKTIPEPVFGQIKQGRGFRRFSFRGLAQVTAEWLLICLTHNLLTLFRSQAAL